VNEEVSLPCLIQNKANIRRKVRETVLFTQELMSDVGTAPGSSYSCSSMSIMSPNPAGRSWNTQFISKLRLPEKTLADAVEAIDVVEHL
jgi:hypothetical protein